MRLQYSVWVSPDVAQRSMFDFQYLLSFSFVAFLDLGMGSPPFSLEALYGLAGRGGRWGLNIAYGTLAYFHPCRLYMNSKLGHDIDYAARMTLETIWQSFVRNGGFYHESAWNCFGPYLTLQLAHAFLLIGDTARMDACLQWTIGNAGYSKVTRSSSNGEMWDVVQGGWNEQHCHSIEANFQSFPAREWWYMGDIPHGWACAEFMMLMRDILFFEADEDQDGKIFIAPGIMPHWLESGNRMITVKQAPTIFGGSFGYGTGPLTFG